jgi:hypothetical protein
VGNEDIRGGGVPLLLSIAIFDGDGSFTTTGNTKFSLASPNQGLADARGPGYGRWAQTSDKEFKLTFYAVLLKGGAGQRQRRGESHKTLNAVELMANWELGVPTLDRSPPRAGVATKAVRREGAQPGRRY